MSNVIICEPPSSYQVAGRLPNKPHDEAFKKLLQTFFLEFVELFFPELHRQIDPAQTRLLMQELLVDVIGEQTRELDLLVQTRLLESDAYILIHLETQSYKDPFFSERMFIYFSRLFERHRHDHRLIIPIALFAYGDSSAVKPEFTMRFSEHNIVHFNYFHVELFRCNWREFIDSSNPIAAALLSKMGYTKSERRQVRTSFLRMILRLTAKLDQARLALIMSFADLYFEPVEEEDKSIMDQLRKEYPIESEQFSELMPAWKRWGFEEGVAKGMEEGIEQGIEQGRKQEKLEIAATLHSKGFTIDEISEMTKLEPIALADYFKQQAE
ncbi:Rpn family recombination-promoting nuclease/putative transposase [Paenibacillus koleovorans]|uniref:Rpn family recombination-promoting nuclease/putative transposase n=1 Tax=Paenibacillus koleovorans TaxID=121608 RepID=UPI000FDCB943|nr:Rpn family recombination-promoting nuclease/putative transposase [Paenibacillus koleovorans]